MSARCIFLIRILLIPAFNLKILCSKQKKKTDSDGNRLFHLLEHLHTLRGTKRRLSLSHPVRHILILNCYHFNKSSGANKRKTNGTKLLKYVLKLRSFPRLLGILKC
jgi:hypothetical protein